MRLALALAALLPVLAGVVGCLNVSCKPMDVNGTNMRCSGGAQGWMWTGTSCIYTTACNCTGDDCQSLYATQDGCETAHVHCR